MDLRSGHPYWLIRNGLLHSFAPLHSDECTDVAVVGGGITGALLAWHLAEAGFETVVLDRRDAGWGSTAASTALIQYEIDTRLTDLIKMYGEEHAVGAYRACREAIYKLHALAAKLGNDCGFSLRPSVQIAPTRRAARELEEELEARRQHGFAVEWMRPEELQSRFGFDAHGAIRSAEAAELDPYRLTHQLLTRGSAGKLRVYDRTKVEKFDIEPGSACLHTDRGVSLRARHVVFATGYEATNLLRKKIVELRSTYAFVSEPMAAPLWPERCLLWERAYPYLYVRSTDDHRVIVGGEDEHFRNPAKRDALIGVKTAKLVEKFTGYFPHLPPEVAFAWGGTFGETKDGLAYIGQSPELPGAYFALGFGGNGITYSVLAAELIRDQLLGRRSPYEGLFGFDR